MTAAVAEDGDAILRNLEILKELDVVSAKAHSAEMLNCNKPEIVGEALLDLKKACHPLLAIKGIEVMPNDLQIGEDFSVLVVSGVNAGGKTVALKTMGLCFLMAMAGLHTPCAEGSRIGMFSELVTVMGDEQSLSDGLSTFSANIHSLNRMLDTCRPDSLLLLDEIIIGTDPQQGAMLAQAVMEKIAAKQARCAVATHYDSLKRLAFSREGFSNAAVGFSEEKLKPTYSLTIGMPGSSSAFNMARELGLADDIVDRAVELDSGGSEIETMVLALEREVERQHEIQAALERKLADIERQKLEYARKLELLKSREWELEDRHQQELLEEVCKAKEEVRGVVRELQKDGSMRDANEALKKLRDQEDELAKRQSRSRQLKREEEQSRKPGARKQPKQPVTNPEDIKTGMWVHISNLDRNGVVVEPPEGNKAALVEVGRLKMRIPTERMCILPASQKPQSKTGKITMSDSFSSVGGDSGKPLTCDLRGEMVDEALSMVDSFLDRALRANAPFVYFIHGHGTGRLKHALRDYLRSVSYVKSFRPGERGEGQDGVTVVVLEDA